MNSGDLQNCVKKKTRLRTGSKIASSEDGCEYFRMDQTGENCCVDEGVSGPPGRSKISHSSVYEQVYTPRLGGFAPRQGAYAPCKQQYTHLQNNKLNAASKHPVYASRREQNTSRDRVRPDIGVTMSGYTGSAGDSIETEIREEQQEIGDEVSQLESSRNNHTYGVVVRYLISLIQTRHEGEVKDEEIFQEWHDVAFVLDRLLFYLFFFITLVSTVSILELRPEEEKI